MRTLFATALLYLTFVAPIGQRAWSQEGAPAPLSETETLGLNNVLSEMVDCATFYTIAAKDLRRRGEDETVVMLQNTIDALDLRIFNVSKTINMMPEAAMIRLKWAMEDQMKLIGNDLANISILVDRYADECEAVIEDYEGRLVYWRNRAVDR